MHVASLSLSPTLENPSEEAKLRQSQEREKELGEAALSSNHQLHQEFGSLEMPGIIYGTSTFQRGVFFWYKARPFFTCAVKWNQPFYSPSPRAIYILYYVMCCFSFSWLPSLHIYTTDPHPRGFPCNFVTHRPSMFMNVLRTHPFLPATFTAQTKNVTIKIFQIEKKINNDTCTKPHILQE